MSKLFISYRSLDSAKVDALVARLRSLKAADSASLYEVWQDKTHIPVGQDWWKAIVQGIIDCDIFVFMVSRASVENVNCRAELSYARRRNRPIVPVVLEEEFTYNPVSGKNDIAYWDHVPDELRDGRYQFLFCEGTAWVNQFNEAVTMLKARQMRDIPAPEPPDPRNAHDATNDTSLIYDRACDYAWRSEFTTAERLFQRLIDWHDPLFSEDAHEWIVLLREYEQMARLDERASARYKIPTLWQKYANKFPKPFATLFDPKGFLTRYGNDKTPAKPKPKKETPPRPPQGSVAPAPDQSKTTTPTDTAGFEDIFEEFFQNFGSRSDREVSGDKEVAGDIYQDRTITLEEAFTGTTVPVQVRRLERCKTCDGSGSKQRNPETAVCPTCDGSGEMKETRQTFLGPMVMATKKRCAQCHGTGEIAVPSCGTCQGAGLVWRDASMRARIPPGVRDGSKVRLKGVGNVDARDHSEHDIYINVTIEPHKIYTRDGNDLMMTRVIEDRIAALGGSIDVETLDGTVSLKIPAGTEDMKVFRLNGKGMPKILKDGSSETRGDLLVRIRLESQVGVLLPQTLSIETLGGTATPMFERDTELPAERSQVFSTAADNQTQVEIHICYGEAPMAEDNISLGKFILDGIPPAPRGIPQIEVTFRVDTDRRLYVTAQDANTGYEKSIRAIELDRYQIPRLTHTLSIETLGGVATPLIARDTKLPAEFEQTFSTSADNQKQVEVHLCYGERPMAVDNKSLGRFILDGIPPAPRGEPQIKVTVRVDANRRLTVSAEDAATGYHKTLDPVDLDDHD